MGNHRLFGFLGIKPRFCKIPSNEWYPTATIVVRPVEDGYAFSDLRGTREKNEQAILTIETCKACKVDLIALLRPALDKQNIKRYSPTALTY